MIDARKKNVLVLLTISGSVLIWRAGILATRLIPSSAQADSGPVGPAERTPTDVSSSINKPDPTDAILKAQAEVLGRPWGRDPFADVIASEEPTIAAVDESMPIAPETAPPAPPLRLSGVSRSGDQWLAAVGGSIVRVGDVVEGIYQVREITKNSITLRLKDWEYRYELGASTPTIRAISEKP